MQKFLLCLGLIAVGGLSNVSTASANHDRTTIQPERVLSVITTDWNNDGGFDRAILIESEPTETELLIYLSDSADIKRGMRLAIAKKKIAWRGALWGTQPKLSLSQAGSLEIISANEAIGRQRWIQKLTVAYQDGSFKVIGYTYTERDTLDLSYELSCDLDFLTGNGSKNGQPFKISTNLVTLEGWTTEYATNQCSNGN
jgi:hypothetical protein